MRSRHRPAPAAIGRSALLLAVARSALVLLRYSPPLCRSSPPRLMSSSSKIPGSLPPSRSIPAAAMDGESPAPPRGACLLVLCGKSDAEKDRARSMASEHNLKLLDAGEEIAVSLLPYSDGAANPTNPPPKMTFRAQRYMDALSTSRFGRLLLWSPRLPSTHDVVSQNFCELPLGSVCVADIQAKGRGRSKNVWESPPGCLMFSFTLQMEDGRAVPLVQYVVSLAVTEAIKDVCRAKDLPFLGVKIKWPNDLYLNGLKVGGILCTSTYRSKKFNVSAGVGLNLDNERPTSCLNAALRGMTSASHKLQREEILASFFNKFEHLFETFLNKGFQVLEELYYGTWLHSGQKVVLEEKQEESVGELVVTIQGLTSSGYLLATDDCNNQYELHPDGNSFDFFKGLVRKKLG